MKKFLSMVLALTMVFSMSVPAFAADFKDTVNIPQSEAIDVIETLGVVNGYGDNIYGPNDILTRAQLCTMLTRALYGDPIYTSTNNFKDVAPSHWANAYINTAYAYGLMSGYGGGYFGPEDKITYTQMAAVIMKALGYDCGKMSWPAGINSMGHTLGLFTNVKFVNYNDGCTRAHAAQMIYNAFDLNFVNHKADYPVVIKNTSFLTDGLGFVETTKLVDGHQYVAYVDKDGELYVTENCLTYERDIYATDGYDYYNCTNDDSGHGDTYHAMTEDCTFAAEDGYAYHFKNSNKAYGIDWYWIDNDNTDGVRLYVNNVEIKDIEQTIRLFAESEKAVGIFNDANDDGLYDANELISIHITSLGKDYVYSITEDADFIDATVKEKDMPKDCSDMTVTYFEEINEYIISNIVDYGWVTAAYKTALVIDEVEVKYDNTGVSAITKDSFVKIYYNYRNEVVHIESIDAPMVYDVTDGIFHTSECAIWNKYTDHKFHTSIDDIKTCDDELCCENETSMTFKACDKCHAKTAPKHEGSIIIIK